MTRLYFIVAVAAVGIARHPIRGGVIVKEGQNVERGAPAQTWGPHAGFVNIVMLYRVALAFGKNEFP